MFFRMLSCFVIAVAILIAPVAEAAERNRLVYHAQMRLLNKGYNPGPVDGVLGNHPFGTVTHPERHALTPCDAYLEQSSSQLVHRVLELLIGDPLIPID